MHARIMLLPGNPAGKQMCSYAEQILTEVSAAFHHSFSLLSEKIGQESLKAYNESLTEETVDACRNCQAVFLGDSECPGAQELLDALELPVLIRSFWVPQSIRKPFERIHSLWLAQVLSLDPETLQEGAQAAFRFAQEMDLPLHHVAPAGAAKADWLEAVHAQEKKSPLVSSASLSAPDAMTMMIQENTAGVILCPPYAGSILNAAAQALSAHPSIVHDASFNQETGVYAPYIVNEEAVQSSPVEGTALAVAKLLRFSLGLSLEAGCVEAAVDNVLAAEEDSLEAIERICEQISVAGELMGKSMLNP